MSSFDDLSDEAKVLLGTIWKIDKIIEVSMPLMSFSNKAFKGLNDLTDLGYLEFGGEASMPWWVPTEKMKESPAVCAAFVEENWFSLSSVVKWGHPCDYTLD